MEYSASRHKGRRSYPIRIRTYEDNSRCGGKAGQIQYLLLCEGTETLRISGLSALMAIYRSQAQKMMSLLWKGSSWALR